ncbi:MAG: hypothetical protein HOW73_35260 [Polyangiaceae bacterium]|nr:hypothetical protein [Polyangiaceae bacterium]
MAELAEQASNWGSHRVFWIDSSKLEGDLEFYRNNAHQFDAIGINPIRGFRLPTVAPLVALRREIHGLILVGVGPLFDISHIKQLSELQVLVVDGPKERASLENFEKLTEFHGDWHKALRVPKRVRVLALNRFAPKTADLTELAELKQLIGLNLTSPGIRSLQQIGSLALLNNLEITGAAKLATLHNIEVLQHLRSVDLFKCPAVSDHELVGACKQITALRFARCGAIKSLAFVESMPALERFSFLGTDVLDGNMRPVLGLKAVGFDARPHFSHTQREVDEILGSRKHG